MLMDRSEGACKTHKEGANASGRKQEAEAWGREAERLASEHLVRQGYALREIRYSPGGSHCDIDIIAELPGIIVFVEVKARTLGEEGDPAEAAQAVDMKKMRRITRLADSYLRSQQLDYDYRFDIIAVAGTPQSPRLEHMSDAFLAPLMSR